MCFHRLKKRGRQYHHGRAGDRACQERYNSSWQTPGDPAYAGAEGQEVSAWRQSRQAEADGEVVFAKPTASLQALTAQDRVMLPYRTKTSPKRTRLGRDAGRSLMVRAPVARMPTIAEGMQPSAGQSASKNARSRSSGLKRRFGWASKGSSLASAASLIAK